MENLYPLKFEPIYKEKIWGGNKLNKILDKKANPDLKIGESWELSAIQDNLSVVKNGFLAGNTIEDLVEIYMGDLIGDRIFFKYGIEFPLLFKYINANDNLSIQVHPDNDTAKFRHFAYGKTEMWYVVDAEPDAEIIIGFKKHINKAEFLKRIEDKSFLDYLNFEKVQKGDVFYIPPGRIHALLKGVTVAEIQQTSDITYRIYDWNRLGLDGKPRELHEELALDVIDFSYRNTYKIKYPKIPSFRTPLVENPYFTTNLIEFEAPIEFNYIKVESFVVYNCISGCFKIQYNQESIEVKKGELVLIPAEFENIFLVPTEKTTILETYIPFVHLDKDVEEN